MSVSRRRWRETRILYTHADGGTDTHKKSKGLCRLCDDAEASVCYDIVFAVNGDALRLWRERCCRICWLGKDDAVDGEFEQVHSDIDDARDKWGIKIGVRGVRGDEVLRMKVGFETLERRRGGESLMTVVLRVRWCVEIFRAIFKMYLYVLHDAPQVISDVFAPCIHCPRGVNKPPR